MASLRNRIELFAQEERVQRERGFSIWFATANLPILERIERHRHARAGQHVGSLALAESASLSPLDEVFDDGQQLRTLFLWHDSKVTRKFF